MSTTITDGYFHDLLDAAATTEKTLSGDKSELKRLIDERKIKRISGRWMGPSHGMENAVITDITEKDYPSFQFELGTAFFLIGEISQIKEMEPPLKSAAARLRQRICFAMDTGKPLVLSEEETVSASNVLEFTVRMCLGQFERITHAFQDAPDDDLDRLHHSVYRIKAVVNKLKNALGYPDSGNIGIHSADKDAYRIWKMAEHLRTGPDVAIPPWDLLEYSGFNS